MIAKSPDRRDALLEAGLGLASELSLSVVLDRIVAAACDLTSARYGAIGVLGPTGTMVDFITRGISPAARRRIGNMPSGRGILGVLMADPRPLRLADISRDPRAAGFPSHHPRMTSFLGAPVLAGGRVFGNIYLTDKRGAAEFSGEDERALTMLASQAAVAITNATLYGAALSRGRWLAAAQTITDATLAGSPIGEILGLVADRACELLAGDFALIATPIGDGDGGLRIEASAGRGIAPLARKLLLSPRGPADRALRGSHPVVTRASHPGGRVQPGRAVPSGASVFARLSGHEGTLGVLGVVGRRGQSPPTPDAVRMVESFAAQAAVALEYARSRHELQRLVLLDERERIAKELHDGVIQSLFAVGMGLQAINPSAAPDEIARRIESAVGELDHVIGDLRSYIFGLRPGILTDRPLGEALRLLTMEFEARCGVSTKVEIDDQVAGRLTELGSDVVQLTREALSNISRHAQAHSCRLRLATVRGWAVLTIHDDGVGFAPSGARTAGLGLLNMEQRVAALGGRMSIRSSPQQGTRVRVALPLD